MTKKRFTQAAALAVVSFAAFLGGCATQPPGTSALTCTPEVRAKYTDGVLSGTLFEDRDVVCVADIRFYPHAQVRKVINIKSVVPYKKGQTCVEVWTVEHDDGNVSSYTVKYIPDGHGGTSFTIRRDNGLSADEAQ